MACGAGFQGRRCARQGGTPTTLAQFWLLLEALIVHRAEGGARVWHPSADPLAISFLRCLLPECAQGRHRYLHAVSCLLVLGPLLSQGSCLWPPGLPGLGPQHTLHPCGHPRVLALPGRSRLLSAAIRTAVPLFGGVTGKAQGLCHRQGPSPERRTLGPIDPELRPACQLPSTSPVTRRCLARVSSATSLPHSPAAPSHRPSPLFWSPHVLVRSWAPAPARHSLRRRPWRSTHVF